VHSLPSFALITSRYFGTDAKKPKFSKVVPTIDEALEDVGDGSMMYVLDI
jgi:hypothetical protein